MKTKFESVGKSKWHCNIPYIFLFILICNCTLAMAQSITWEKTYDRAGNFIDGIECSVMDDSGNFVLAGWTTIPPFTLERLWLLKIRPNGDTIWTRMVDIRGYVLSITTSGDGGFVLTGDAGQAFAVKIDANGSIIWQRFYGGVGVQLERINRTSDNGFILCGIYDLTNGYVLKINSEGILQKQYILNLYSRFFDVKQTTEGDYVLCGLLEGGNYSKSLILKLDSLLNPIWLRSFSLDLFSHFRDVHMVKSGFTLIGGSRSDGFDLETTLTRVSEDGDSISYHKISRFGSEFSPSSVKLSEKDLPILLPRTV